MKSARCGVADKALEGGWAPQGVALLDAPQVTATSRSPSSRAPPRASTLDVRVSGSPWSRPFL